MSQPREIIEDIRRSEYGIGLPPGSPERIGFDKLRPKLDKAIQHLSEDLYTEDIHFVLELVQNAEDNAYRQRVKPFLRFVRRNGVLLVQNNETGFEEKNVRALCSIGESSKTKAFGYIGEKGIGFKSVFRVSDEPHIISNGFSFRFRREDPATGLGFVVPEWVEEAPDFVDPLLTNVVLPLRRQADEEVRRIERLAPSLLLFLKKLKLIEVQDLVRGRTVRHKRIDRPDGVELRTGKKKKRFRLVSSMNEVPHTRGSLGLVCGAPRRRTSINGCRGPSGWTSTSTGTTNRPMPRVTRCGTWRRWSDGAAEGGVSS
jgi:hypothetical protein